MTSPWSPGGNKRPAWASQDARASQQSTPKTRPDPGELQLSVSIIVRRSEKFLEVKHDAVNITGLLWDTWKGCMTHLTRKKMLSLQVRACFVYASPCYACLVTKCFACRLCTQTKYNLNSHVENPLYKKGYQGYSMVAADGNGFTVAHAEVGELARQVYNHILPLKDGPFGGADQPPARCLASLKLVITDGPLRTEAFDSIDEFVAAIDALANPAASEAEEAGTGPTRAELQAAVTMLFDRVEVLESKVLLQTTQLAELHHQVHGVGRRNI